MPTEKRRQNLNPRPTRRDAHRTTAGSLEKTTVTMNPFIRPAAIVNLFTPRAAALAAALALTASASSLAAQETNSAASQPAVEKKAEKGPPLPLHQIEGNGGIFSTLSAYIVNPPRNGEPVGRPSAGFSFVDIGHGQNLEALTLTESP